MMMACFGSVQPTPVQTWEGWLGARVLACLIACLIVYLFSSGIWIGAWHSLPLLGQHGKDGLVLWGLH